MSNIVKGLADHWRDYQDGVITKKEYDSIKLEFEQDAALCNSFGDKLKVEGLDADAFIAAVETPLVKQATFKETFYQDLQPKPSRKVSPVDTSLLNSQQKGAFDNLSDYLYNIDTPYACFLLEGYAGTGKTYTISMVIEDYLIRNPNASIAVTAPVNKAVKVLRNSATYVSEQLSYITVHSLLGLKPQVTANGEIEYVRDANNNTSKIETKNLVILDEVSMLNDELFTLIYQYVISTGLKVIFLGDSAQIPPVRSKGHVGGSESIPLTEKGREKYQIGRVVLTDIVRQKGGSPIIELATTIRTSPLYRDLLESDNYTDAPVLEDGEELESMEEGVVFSKTSNKNFMRKILARWFTGHHFKHNADHAKVIAWTNKTVDTFNVIIRKMLYGNKAANICIGEKLLADTPIVDIDSMEKRIVFTTNDEFTVLSYEIHEQNVHNVQLKYYYAEVEHDTGSKKVRERIRIIHEHSYEAYGRLLSDIKDLAIEKTKEKKGLPYWKTFYAIQENFAAVKYNYAITAHKAQGSTYTNVMVVESDINANDNIRERNRIKYTACSRPSKLLVIAQ